MANEDLIPVVHGRATYLIPSDLGEGEYTITATYTDESEDYGTHHYASSQCTNTLYISKHAFTSILDLGSVSNAIWNDEIQPSVQFSRDGVVYPGETVYFYIQGEDDNELISIGEGVTDEYGWATLEEPYMLSQDVLPPWNKSMGGSRAYEQYQAVLECWMNSTSDHNFGKGFYEIQVYRRDLKITLNDPGTITSGEKVTYSGMVEDKYNTADTSHIPGMTLHYLMGATELGKEELESSIFSKTLKPTGTGADISISVHCDGSDLYNEAEVSNSVNIRDVVEIALPDSVYGSYYILNDKDDNLFSATVSVNNNPTRINQGIDLRFYDTDTGDEYSFTAENTPPFTGLSSSNLGAVNQRYTPTTSAEQAMPKLLLMEWSVPQSDSYEFANATAHVHHRRKTKATIGLPSDSVGYLVTKGVYEFPIHFEDSQGEPCADESVALSAVIKDDDGNVIEEHAIDTGTFDKNGDCKIEWTISRDFPLGKCYMRCTCGEYTIENTNKTVRSDWYQKDTDELEVTVICSPTVSITDYNVRESYETSCPLGDMYEETDNVVNIEGTVYKYYDYGKPTLANVKVTEVYLQYVDDITKERGCKEVIYQFDGWGDEDTRIGRDSNGEVIEITKESQVVRTNEKGVFSIPYRVPCGLLNFENTLKVTFAQEFDEVYHTSFTTETASASGEVPLFKVRRYYGMEIPSQYLTINEHSDIVIHNVADSHGADVDQIQLYFSNTTNAGVFQATNILFEDVESNGNMVLYPDYVLDPERLSVTVTTEYNYNAWSLNSDKYITKVIKDGAETSSVKVFTSNGNISLKVNPEILLYMSADPTDSDVPYYECMSSKAHVCEGTIAGLGAIVRYPWKGSSDEQNYYYVNGFNVKFVYHGDTIGTATTYSTYNNQARLNWTVPTDSNSYGDEMEVLTNSSDEHYLSGTFQFPFYIKRYIEFTPNTTPEMTPTGIFYLDGTVTTKGNKPAPPTRYRVKCIQSDTGSNIDPSSGYTFGNYGDTSENDWMPVGDEEGNLKDSFDNASTTQGRVSELKAGETYYYWVRPTAISNKDTAPNTYCWTPSYHKFTVAYPTETDKPMIMDMTRGRHSYGTVTLQATIVNSEGRPIFLGFITFTHITNSGERVLIAENLSSNTKTGLVSTTVDIPYTEAQKDWTYEISIDAQSATKDGVSTSYKSATGTGKIDVVSTLTITRNSDSVFSSYYTDSDTSVATLAATVTNPDNTSAGKISGEFNLVSGYPEGGVEAIKKTELSTTSDGTLACDYDVTNKKWFFWRYFFTHPESDTAVYSDCHPIKLYNKHRLKAVIKDGNYYTSGYKFWQKYGNGSSDDTYHVLKITVYDSMLGDGVVSGRQTCTSVSTYNIYNDYDLQKLKFLVTVQYEGKRYLIKNDPLAVFSDNILGDPDSSRQRKLSNVEINVKGDVSLPVILIPLTKDNVDKYEFYTYCNQSTSYKFSASSSDLWDNQTFAYSDYSRVNGTITGNIAATYMYDTDPITTDTKIKFVYRADEQYCSS